MTKQKESNKKLWIGLAILVVIVAALAIIYSVFRAKPVEGSKAITIEIISKEENSTI